MGYAQVQARLRRAITKVAATGTPPTAIVREVFGDVAQRPLSCDSGFLGDSGCRSRHYR
jgi:hypothetical protein